MLLRKGESFYKASQVNAWGSELEAAREIERIEQWVTHQNLAQRNINRPADLMSRYIVYVVCTYIIQENQISYNVLTVFGGYLDLGRIYFD